MRLYGTLSELVKIVFRSGGRETKLDAAQQTGSQTDVTFRLPDLVNNSGSAVVKDIIVKDLAQIDNDDIAAGAGIVDTKLATISTAGKVSNSATTATDANTPSAIVARDGSGNFSAGTITASLSGNASTATTATSFSGSLSGEVTGTQSATVVADDVIDNANIKSTAAIAYSKLNLASSIVNADIASAAAIADTKLATISTAGKVANSATTATSSATPSTIVSRDGAGATNLSALGVAGNLTTANLEATGQSLLQFAYINGTAGMGFVELEGQSSTPAAPTTGEARLFAGTDGKIYVRKAGSASAEELGASGSGEVNLVDTPSDAGQWTGVNATVTTNTTAANNPLAGVIDSSISIASSTLNGYARTRFTMPSALKNRKLKLEWFQIASSLSSGAYKVEVYTNASSDYSGAYTELALSTDSSGTSSIPNLNGKYSTTFDTATADYYEIRLVRTAASAATIYLANVVCGPGIQPQGAVVSAWTNYTPTITGLTSAYTIGYAEYARRGDQIQVRGRLNVTATGAGSGAIIWSLPAGLTISAVDSGTVAVGNGTWFNASNEKSLIINHSTAVSTTGFRFMPTYNVADQSLVGTSVANGDVIWFTAECKVAEWAGSGTVQLAQNDVEYAYNSSTSTSADDTSSFAYGPSGAQIQAITAQLKRQVRFPTPIQPSDKLTVELSTDQKTWYPAGALVGSSGVNVDTLRFDGTNNIGVGLWSPGTLAATDVHVFFGRYSSGVTTSWTTPATTYWRVKKEKAGAAVGFGLVQPGVSAGLVSAAGLAGNTTGNAIAGGYVGEVLSFTAQTTTGVLNSVVAAPTALTTLTAGVWLLVPRASFTPSTSITNMKAYCATNNNNDFSGSVAYLDLPFSYTATTEPCNMPLSCLQVMVVSSTQAIYAKSYSGGIARNVTISGFAIRIA